MVKVKTKTSGKTEKSYLIIGEIREKAAASTEGCTIASVWVITVGVGSENVAAKTLGETTLSRLTTGAWVLNVAERTEAAT
jgi:hypothetical protein